MTGSTAAFSDEMLYLRERVDASLDENSRFGDGCPVVLRKAIRHSLLAPGKRLRPILVLSAAEACGATCDLAMPAACAVEMIHTYSLIHDDLPAMDDDLLRRGLPTCHAVFGEANAILAGDALQARAFEIIATQILPGELAARCCAELAQAAGAQALVGGQFDDLDAEFKPGTVEQLQQIHRRKTGALLMVCLRLGGLIGGVTSDGLLRLQQYGECLGLAFQIVDDLLDIGGDQTTMGKQVKKDADVGKLTYPGLLGIDASRRLAKELIDNACNSIAFLGAQGNRLQQIARYVEERDH
jgi:geranylgeranyl diphosphate synthase type II